jgi:tRNA-dihydrouridine synthase
MTPAMTPDRWEHPTAFAPLEGVGGPWLRELMAAQGGIGLFCAPYLSVGQVPVAAARLAQQVVATGPRPLSVQLLGTHPRHLTDAAAALARLGADVVDLNLGCPARHAVSRGAGAGLLAAPDLVRQLMTRLRAVVPGTLSAKMRLGLHDTRSAGPVADALVAAGADLVTVHARRQSDFYAGLADWRYIRDLASRLPIPVVGNGDCWYAKDALRMLRETGCAAVMIGRPALRNPWIFSQIAALRAGRPPFRPAGPDVVAWLRAAAARLTAGPGPCRGVTGNLKELISHLGRAVDDGGAFRKAALKARGIENILAVTEAHLGSLGAERLDLQADGHLGFEVSGRVREA